MTGTTRPGMDRQMDRWEDRQMDRQTDEREVIPTCYHYYVIGH